MNSPVDLNFSEMREHCSIKLKKNTHTQEKNKEVLE